MCTSKICPTTTTSEFVLNIHGRIQRGAGGPDPPPEISQKYGGYFFCNTGPDRLKNHKTTKPAFNVGPSSVRQRNAISVAFRWRADDGPFKEVFGWSLYPLINLKGKNIKFEPPLTKLSGSAHGLCCFKYIHMRKS